MDQQELDLRRQTAGTGVDVIRQGDGLFLRIAVERAPSMSIARRSARNSMSTLDEIGRTLKSYNQTYIDVLGHTDSTGTDADNQALSEKRAQRSPTCCARAASIAARMATRGYGESQPIGDNDTDAGRALNRRVEIKIVPLRG